MERRFSRLLGQISWYALGNVLFKVAGFLLAFIYLDPEYLSEAAFGRLALLDVTGRVLIPLLALGLGPGLLKFWADPAHAHEKGALSFTALIATFGCGLVAFVLFYFLAEPASVLLFGRPTDARLFRLFGGFVALKIIAKTPSGHLRNLEKPQWVAAASGLEMVFLVGGVYYLLVIRGAGLEGVMLAYLVSSGVSTAALAGGVLATVPWRFKPQFLRRLIQFGMPLAWVGIGAMLLNVGDRYLLQWFNGPVSVGIYDWSGRLGSVLYLLFVSSFHSAFTVLGVKALSGEGEAAEEGFHRRTFRHFAIWTGWGVVGLSLLAYDVTLWISESAVYLAAEYLVLPIAIGYLFYGVYSVMNNLIYAGGRSGAIAQNIFLAAMFNIILNLALIPLWGVMGAAVATAISYAALLAVTTRIAYRHTSTRFPWTVLGKVLVLIIVLYVLGRLTFDWSTPARLAARLLLIAAYPVGVYAWRLYSPEEWRELAAIVRKRLGT